MDAACATRHWIARTCLRGDLGSRLFQLVALVGYCERSGVHAPVIYAEDICPNPHGSPDAVLEMFPMISRKHVRPVLMQERCFDELSPFTAEPIPIVHTNVFITGDRQAAGYAIRADGTFILPRIPEMGDRSPRSLFPQIVFEHAAFMHVCRGDSSVHDFSLQTYYEVCLKELIQFFKHNKPLSASKLCIVLLSDDPVWAYAQYANIIRDFALELKVDILLDCETDVHKLSDVEHLTAMAACALGGICANASLSWWGACLSHAQHGANSYFPSPWLAEYKVDHPPWTHVFSVDTGLIARCEQRAKALEHLDADAPFIFFEGLDFSGNDLARFCEPLTDQMRRAREMPNCIAFNSLGFFKEWKFDFSTLASRCMPSPYFKQGDGIHVKSSIAATWLAEWIKVQKHYAFVTQVTIKGDLDPWCPPPGVGMPLLARLKLARARSTCLAVTSEGELLCTLTAFAPVASNGTGIWIKRSTIEAHPVAQAVCRLRSIPVPLKMPETLRTISKIAFITAIYGAYELSCKPAVAQSVPCDFIAFADTVPIETSGWIVDTFPYHAYFATASAGDSDEFVNKTNNHPFMIAKFYKQAFHHIPRLQQYDTIIWIDGTIEIKHADAARLAQSRLQYFDIPVLSWQHEHRLSSGLAGEVAASIHPRYCSTHWAGHAQPFQPITQQFEAYIREGYQDAWFEGPSVAITCFVAFNMCHALTIPFLQLWYRQTRAFSTQDQVGFSYTCWKQKIKPYLFPDYSVKGANPHVSTDLYKKHDHHK